MKKHPKRYISTVYHRTFIASITSEKDPNKKGKALAFPKMLPDLDSNQDKLNQNQLYCHYTIGQSMHSVVEWGAKIGVGENCSKFFNRSVRILNSLL